MRISSIHLDRFGNRDHLFLEGLSDTLNVVFGPNGSGKSTTIGFVRWMLYGGSENARRGFDLNAAVSASGRLTIHNRGRQQTIARQDDGTRYGRVHLDGIEHIGVETNHLVPLLADVGLHDFDRIFAPNFDQEPNLSSLLQSAQARGINLATTRLPSDRVQELRLRIDQLRRDMQQLPWQGQALVHLIERRDTLKRRIEALEEDRHKRRGSLQAEYDDLNRQIKLRESDIERIRGDWHAKDNEVAARRRALEEAWRRAEEAKQEYLRKLRNDLADVEAHLARARNMVGEMRQRYEGVNGDLRDYEVERPYGRRQEDSQCQVESIARQLDELRSMSLDRPYAPDTYRQNTSTTWTHGQAGLDRLRSEISRLCDDLQLRREGAHAGKLEDELRQLRQCEESTTRWVEELQRQRNQLADELEQAERFGVSLVLDQRGERPDAVYEDHGLIDPSRIKAVLHTCDGYQPIAPDADRLLQQLIREREMVHGELESAERHLRRLLDRRRTIESALERFADFEANNARRELAEVESQIRIAEDRERLQDEVDRLEAERATVNEHWGHAPVTQRAAELLRRLSGGQLIAIRVEGVSSVWVEDMRGHWLLSEQLSRGSRDQLHLAFCMAIIGELRDSGVELPLLLNDAFVNVDSRRDQVLADVIHDFARQGFQVILFTRHQHVAHIFETLHARMFQLGAQLVPVSQPIEKHSVEQVRFRQQDHGAQREPRRVDRPHSSSTVNCTQRRRPQRCDFENVMFVNSEHALTQNQQPLASDSDLNVAITSHTRLNNLDLLDDRELAAFRTMGVTTIGDFLETDSTSLTGALRQSGLADRPVGRWQVELGLCVQVQGLTLADARVLAAAGITEVRELASTDPESLCQRIERYLASAQSRRGYSSPMYRLSRRQATSWIRDARAAYERPLGPSFSDRHGHDGDKLQFSSLRSESEDLDWFRENRGVHDDDSDAAQRRSRGPMRSEQTARSSKSRQGRRTRSSGRRRRVDGDVEPRSRSHSTRESAADLKFYLHTTDSVVDAPSIGPRTAERLSAAGITTVSDLLQADPEQVAERAGHSRITEEGVRQWQAQSLLACRIPVLRGHDAQILVACGLESPEQVAQISADELWDRVRPFIRTSEGKRVIRSRKEPDLDEVRDWVRFAQSARALSAA